MRLRKCEVWLGVPAAQKVQIWQEREHLEAPGRETGWLEQTRLMAEAAPAGLRRVGARVAWKPKPVLSQQERDSAICIRFQQTRAPSRPWHLDMDTFRRTVLQTAIAVQTSLHPDATKLSLADIWVNGIVGADDLMKGVIMIAAGDKGESEARCSIGFALAFLINNRRTDEVSGAFKWLSLIHI